MRSIRIFVSSPSDVSPERAAVQRVLERLKRQYHGRLDLDGLLWEDLTYDAATAFHRQIPLPSEFDVVVFILWSRLGTPITVNSVQYASGTVFEYEDALRASSSRRLPLLMYRKQAPLQLDITLSQAELLSAKSRYDQVQEFFKKYFEGHDGGLRAHNFFKSVADFEERLEEDLRKTIEDLRAAGPAQAVVPVRAGSPYRGLQLFDESDQHIFFGRTRALYQVVRALRNQDALGRPFVVVFGRSGVGKSSFIRASVSPYITGSNTIEGVSVWRRCLFEPSDSTVDLIGGLAAALCAEDALPELAEGQGGAEGFARLLRENATGAVSLVRHCISNLAPSTGGDKPRARLLLLVDPLEEVFTRRAKVKGDDAEEAVQRRKEQLEFAQAISLLCRDGLVWVVATLRSDFYEQASAIAELRELKEGDGQYHLAPLTAMELSQAVLRPAEIAGLTFEESAERGHLAEELINAALEHTDPLPLLSYTLDQLYERSSAATTGLMTFRAFDELGGLKGALARRADEARNDASNRMRGKMSDAWNRVFGLLIDIDRDGRRVRLYSRLDQFSDPDADALREELDHARLLITDKDDQGRPVVSIAHESMLREWPSLREWIDDRAELLRLRSALATEAREFSITRSPDLLILQGARLAKAEDFVKNHAGLDIDHVIQDYVQANVARRDEAARRQKAQARRILLIVAVGVLVISVAGAFAYLQRVRFRDQQKTTLQLADELLLASTSLGNDGRDEAAASVLDQSIRIYEASTMSEPKVLAERLDQLASYYYKAADYAGNERALRKTIEVRESAGLGQSNEALISRGYLGGLYKTKSRYVAAIAELRQSIAIAESTGNPTARKELAAQYDQLADILRNLDRFDESDAASRRAIEIARQLVKDGDDSMPPVAAAYESEYAVLIAKRGRPREAQQLLERIIREYPGKHDRNYAAVLYKYVRVLVDLDELAAADDPSTESCQIIKAVSPTHPRMAKALEARAMVRLKQGRAQEAVADLKEVLKIRTAKLVGPNPDIQLAHELLAKAYEKLNLTGDAQFERDEAVRIAREFDALQRKDAAELGVPYP